MIQMRNIISILLLTGCISWTAISYAQAQDSSTSLPDSASAAAATPQGFENDSSKPDPEVTIPQPEADNTPVSSQTNAQWQAYDQPIRQCIEGDTIIPSDGGDVFGFLFNNTAQTDVTMAIQGWKHDKCAINLTEGVNTMYCLFDRAGLRELMNSIISQDQFDRSGAFAQTLTAVCQATAPDQQGQ